MKSISVRSVSRQLIAVLAALLLVALTVMPTRAGEPTGDIGPMNPTMFECIDDDGDIIELDTIQDIIDNDATTETSSCLDNFEGVSDFGFDTTDSVLFEGYLDRIEDECEEEGGDLQPVQRTRIEGTVYEFHPVDPANPGTSEWVGVPSRDVPVVAQGIGLDTFWGSEEDGSFAFSNLGAGPIQLNLRLPPDAHPINPGQIIKSTGRDETLPVFLGFYRGDLPAPSISQLRSINGSALPFAAEEDLVLANRCGLPIPNVGGAPAPARPISLIILAAAFLAALPLGGLLTLRRSRRTGPNP